MFRKRVNVSRMCYFSPFAPYSLSPTSRGATRKFGPRGKNFVWVPDQKKVILSSPNQVKTKQINHHVLRRPIFLPKSSEDQKKKGHHVLRRPIFLPKSSEDQKKEKKGHHVLNPEPPLCPRAPLCPGPQGSGPTCPPSWPACPQGVISPTLRNSDLD